MVFLYIDPGTGSMLFSILITAVAAAVYFLRGFFIRFKTMVAGGKEGVKDSKKKDLIIYSDSKRYWNMFGPICDELEKRRIDAEYWTSSQDDPAFDEDYKHIKSVYIGEGNKSFAKLNFAKAKLLFSTTPGVDVLQWKRSKDVDSYVHILHAVSSATGYRMFGLDGYDAVLLSSEFQKEEIRELEKLRGIKEKELVIVGQPYLDQMKMRADETESERAEGKTVLLAPSWGQSSILVRYGAKILRALLDTGYQIIVRPHPQSFTADKAVIDGLMKDFPSSEQLLWNRDNDNFDVLRKSDIMITDFSGVILDYTLIFDRPIIYVNSEYDSAPYDDAWLKEERWELKILPKLGKELEETDFDKMKEVIDAVLGSSEYAAGIAEARREAWLCPGEGAKRVVNYLENKLETV